MKKTNKIMILLTLLLVVLSGCSDNTTNEAEEISENIETIKGEVYNYKYIECDKVFYDNNSLPEGKYDCELNTCEVINTCNNENLI